MLRRSGSWAMAALLFSAAAVPAARGAEGDKAVFESVSYSEDLDLKSAYFVDDEVGWVSGEAGTILHTEDGGASWSAQLGGDPQGSEEPIDDLFFLDRNTGWGVGGAENVVQRKLLGTTDGQTWRQVGVMGTEMRSYTDYVFTSRTTGLFLEGGEGAIQQTRDGGRRWAPVLPACKAKVRMAGLTKEVNCSLKDLFFLTPTLGWAAGAGANGTVFVLGTRDGGTTWEYLYVEPDLGHPDEPHFDQYIFFTDESNGFLALPRADKLLATRDGGKTWEAAPVAPGGGRIYFADPEVGWVFGGEKLLYTTNGGKSWTSRPLRFPAQVNAFSTPSRRNAYVVGASGMVFRYRVVAASYENPDAVAAPLLPQVGETLKPELVEIREHAAALQAGLETAPAGAEGQAQPAPAELIADCCAAEMQALQADVGSFMEQVPLASTRYRNLNLILAGLQMISDLAREANGMRDAFRALQTATDVGSATAALQSIVTGVDSMQALVADGFDGPPALPASATPVASDSGEQVEEDTSAEAAEAEAEAEPKPDSEVEKTVKETIKRKLKFPKLR